MDELDLLLLLVLTLADIALLAYLRRRRVRRITVERMTVSLQLHLRHRRDTEPVTPALI